MAIFLVLGVLALSLALRTFSWTPLRKLGVAGIFVATFLFGYYAAGRNIWVGAAFTSFWFVFPWVEIVARTRKMRIPVQRELSKKRPPGNQRFPELASMTDEVEEQGFEHVSDSGWDWEERKEFFRFFYHEEKRMQAVICFTEQEEGISWSHINITSRYDNDEIYRSINIPFSSSMKSAPNVIIRRDTSAMDFEEYLNAHEAWLTKLGLSAHRCIEQDDADIFDQVEQESGLQIQHNLDSGIIALCDQQKNWRYSWRGLIFLYFQVLKDFARWC